MCSSLFQHTPSQSQTNPAPILTTRCAFQAWTGTVTGTIRPQSLIPSNIHSLPMYTRVMLSCSNHTNPHENCMQSKATARRIKEIQARISAGLFFKAVVKDSRMLKMHLTPTGLFFSRHNNNRLTNK